jgi:hypothetical protein
MAGGLAIGHRVCSSSAGVYVLLLIVVIVSLVVVAVEVMLSEVSIRY